MPRAVTIFLSFFLFFEYVYGGDIRGKVKDVSSSEDLTGATILIRETGKGTTSGLDGSFLLKDIAPGKYTLECRFVSFETQIRQIELKKDENYQINFVLQPLSIQMGEVVIKADAGRGSEIGAKLSEQQSVQIINALSARSIELSPDLNIASVVQRISGVTLDKQSGSSGQYALLRGMDKRYNYTLVNGIKIPSTHNKHRYVSLELFPSDMVERLEVIKALTPDLEGDAIAGAVNMIMKNAPDQRLVQINISSGYSLFFFDRSFETFDTKTLNSKSPYERNSPGYLAKPDDFSKENLRIANSFPLNYAGNITLGNRFLRGRLGILFAASNNTTHFGTYSLYFKDDLSRDGKNLPVLRDMQERFYSERKANTGLHTKLDYRIGNRDHLKLYAAYIALSNTQLREVQKTDLVTSYDPDNGNVNRSFQSRFRYNFQSLLNATLQGEHLLRPGLSAHWSLVASEANNKTPEEATVIYGNSLRNFGVVDQYVDFDGSPRIWRRNTDGDKAVYLDFTNNPDKVSYLNALQFGGMFRHKNRKSFYNKYTLNAIKRVVLPDTSYISFYSEKDVDWITYDQIQWRVYNPRGTIAVGENYKASEDVVGTYALLRGELDRMSVTGGLRFEYTRQGYDMEFPVGEPNPKGNSDYFELLPSLHLKYALSTNRYIRLSYFKALNKPGFHEIVPYVDASDEPTFAGNKDLKHAVAHNVDLRFEYFPAGLDQLMAGLFYKKIHNAIEYAFIKYMNISQNTVFSPINTDNASNYGFEIDLVKFYRQWGVRANYTRTFSSITTNKLARLKDANGNDYTEYIEQTRPLFGQSANVGNLSLLYRNTENGLNAQAALSYTGDRIYSVSQFIDNDLWQKGFWQLDASFEKSFKNGLGFYGKLLNLLNTHTLVYIKKTNPLNSDVPFHDESDKSTLVRDEYTKAAFLIGIRYKL